MEIRRASTSLGSRPHYPNTIRRPTGHGIRSEHSLPVPLPPRNRKRSDPKSSYSQTALQGMWKMKMQSDMSRAVYRRYRSSLCLCHISRVSKTSITWNRLSRLSSVSLRVLLGCSHAVATALVPSVLTGQLFCAPEKEITSIRAPLS